MVRQPQEPPELFDGFTRSVFPHSNMCHDVYSIGNGAPVIILHELPGLERRAIIFARRLAKSGFQVYLPHLFGKVGKRQTFRNYRALCVSKEFSNLAAGVSAPITCWLRALAKDVSGRGSGSRVGAIGMCLTGAFVIPLVLEPCVAAPVTSQPAIPLSMLYRITGLGGTTRANELNISDEDLAAAAERLRGENMTLLAFRFEEDRLCPRARFNRLKREFDPQLEVHEYGGCSFLRKCLAPRHSVLTGEYRTSRSDPNNQAFERVCAFMREHLNSE
jgi:dienelactone hydrolase